MSDRRSNQYSNLSSLLSQLAARCIRRSETVNLDCVLRDALFDEESGDLQPLVTLELDDLAGLFIINESTVTSEFLMEER